jgi:MazG family protein
VTREQANPPPRNRPAEPSAAPGPATNEPAGDAAAARPDPAAGPAFDRALALVRFLRARCPWDASQTPDTLLPYLLEEAHEVADAVLAHDDDALRDELGDLLLNVAFQTVLAEERGAFGAEDAVRALEAKMRRRHPHLYGGGPPEPWERLKAKEREAEGPASVLSGLAAGLDPLSRAQRIQDRVSAVGFDWASARGAFDKVAEELEEVRQALEAEPSPALEEELGDLLFSVVNLTRLSGAHAMRALQRANAKFARRFEALERLARQRGMSLESSTLEQLDALWDEVKRAESSPPST